MFPNYCCGGDHQISHLSGHIQMPSHMGQGLWGLGLDGDTHSLLVLQLGFCCDVWIVIKESDSVNQLVFLGRIAVH